MKIRSNYLHILSVLIYLFSVINSTVFAQVNISDSIINRYLQVHNNFRTTTDVEGNYTLDLNVEAIIHYTQNSGDTTYLQAVERFFALRNFHFSETVPHEKNPFCDVYFEYLRLKNASSFIRPYLNESRRMMRNLVRTPEGVICIRHKGEDYMLIDYVQEYIARMAKTGWLTGDTLFYREAVDQLQLYRSILQYPDSKLYSQGRGWMEDKNEISPSAWSRGQGWLMRGMETTLEFMPPNSVYVQEMKLCLKEFTDGLLKRQDATEMWHTLPLLPNQYSYPEVSGTAMIACYKHQVYKKGFLLYKRFVVASKKAKHAILNYIGKYFSVSNVSKGSGPLTDIKPSKLKGKTSNQHCIQTVINLLSLNF